MEQYLMPKKLDFKNLKLCLKNYPVDFLFIRLIGSMGGTVKVSEKLEGKKLSFKKDRSGLRLFIDEKEVFHFPVKDYLKGFTLAYERFEPITEKMVMLGHGIDPYDSKLPEPKRSFLRIILDWHLLEIYFKGKIDLKFHSWWEKPHWRYWTVDKPKHK